jgi:hypothetical protein
MMRKDGHQQGRSFPRISPVLGNFGSCMVREISFYGGALRDPKIEKEMTTNVVIRTVILYR